MHNLVNSFRNQTVSRNTLVARY